MSDIRQCRHHRDGRYGWHQRDFDARTGELDVWNIRLHFWELRLVYWVNAWTDGRCLRILLAGRHLCQWVGRQCRHLGKVWLLVDVAQSTFRDIDARTGVVDIWNIRLHLRQLRLVHRVDGRAHLRCNRTHRHLRFHGHRLFRLLRLRIGRWSLWLRNLRSYISLKFLILFPHALHVLIVVGKYGVAELVVVVHHALSCLLELLHEVIILRKGWCCL